MKIRDAAKMAGLALASAILGALALVFRDDVEPIVNRLPLKSSEPFWPLMYVLAISTVLGLSMAIWYLATTPAQNAAFLHRMKHKGRVPEQFDWNLLDESDPNFRVSTWKYMCTRLRK